MKISTFVFAAGLAGITAFGTVSKPVHAQASDQMIGQMMLFAGNFCPRNWAAASGQLLSISSNQALYSILGTTYGGDGRTTFGLPDLRGRVPVSVGTAAGLSTYRLGQKTGTESNTLTVPNLPPHNHRINTTKDIAANGGPGDKYLGAMGNRGSAGPFVYSATRTQQNTLAADAVSNTGNGVPITNIQPTLGMQWCIAIIGTYPSRN